MSKIYGNYWGEDQVVVAQIPDTSGVPDSVFKGDVGTPAFIAAIVDTWAGTVKDYIFVEIIPGTERHESYINHHGQFETGTCVKVNIYTGPTFKFETMTLSATDSWPLKWFKLTKVPPTPYDPYTAYERAMSIIGG